MFPTASMNIESSPQPINFVIHYLQTQIKNRQELLVPLQLNLNHLERLAREEARRKMDSMNYMYSPSSLTSNDINTLPPTISLLTSNSQNQGNLSQTLSGQSSFSPPSPSNNIDRHNHIKLQIQNIQYEIDILQTATRVLYNQSSSNSFV